MRRFAWIAGGMAWFVVASYLTFRVSFPEGALLERARYELDRGTGGAMSMDIGGVSPWWVGLKASDVTLFTVAGSGDTAEATELVHVDQARVSVSPWSLIRGRPSIGGRIFLGDGDISFSGVAAGTGRGGTQLESLSIDAVDFPMAALPPVGGASLVGKGSLDLVVDLDAPDGMNKAEGSAHLTGKDVVIDDIAPFGPVLQPLGVLPVLVEELDLDLAVTQGKAAVKRGRLATSLGTAEIAGEITLQNDLTRSRLKLTLTLELAPEAAMVGGMLGASKWADGKYHGSVSGQLGRPSVRWESERSSRPTGRVSSPMDSEVRSTPAPASSDLEERRRRAAERREKAMEAIRSGDVGSGADTVGTRVRPLTRDDRIEPPEFEPELLDTELPPEDPEEGVIIDEHYEE